MLTTSSAYDHLRADIAELPIVDCHEHVTSRERTSDVFQFLLAAYLQSDVTSSLGDAGVARLLDTGRSVEERFAELEPAWRAVRFTGYGIGTRRALAKLFGTDELTLANVKAWQDRLPDYSDPQRFDAHVREARIEASVSDNWPSLSAIMDGSFKPLPWQHLAISLPQFHAITRRSDLEPFERAAGATVTSLGEYVELCRTIFLKWRECGAVCMKDQSAYSRRIGYSLPARADAERSFNTIVSDPRSAIAYESDGGALSDYLMHEFMRIAREMELPVQIHTGHMAGIRNDVAKANASGLRSLLEVHRDVRFDLFHANWPYLGDLLFLVKNYPNVAMDMCWAYAIDPLYAKETLKRAVLTVPATKIHGFGSDVGGMAPHLIWSYSEVARDVIAAALSELVEERVIPSSAAVELAGWWLHANPRRFFGLERKELYGGVS